MSEENERETVWTEIWVDKPEDDSFLIYNESQYRRIPTLPDGPMEDMYEVQKGIYVAITGLGDIGYCYVKDAWQSFIPAALVELLGWPNPNETHHVQDNKIVRKG